jgi:hypothetical protein
MPSKTIFWFLAITLGLALLLLAAGRLDLGTAQPGLLVPTVTGWPTRTKTITATPTLPGTITVTPTPTSHPGIPQLLEPDDGGLMPQPVAPAEWYFLWDARDGPCWCYLSVGGPGGRGFYVEVDYPYEYHYRGEVIPDDALGPWHWSVSVICPLGSNHSETRTFFVESYLTPTPTTAITPSTTSTEEATPTLTAPSEFTPTVTPVPSDTVTITPTPSSMPPDHFMHLPLVIK